MGDEINWLGIISTVGELVLVVVLNLRVNSFYIRFNKKVFL
jgi:hypothetical protein